MALGHRTIHSVALLGLFGAVLGLPTTGAQPMQASSGAPTADQWRAMGHMSSKSGTLRPGCRGHYYTYRVTPPAGHDWSLETFLIGPGGKRLGSDVIISGADAAHGSKKFTICRSNTRPGRFVIRGKLSYVDSPDQYSGWITPTRFWLRKP